MSDSETEPESDVSSSLFPLNRPEFSTPAHLVDTSQTDSPESDPISAVHSAIKVLESLDFSLIRKVVPRSKLMHLNTDMLKPQDASLHEVIQESSTTLLQFLHRVLTMSPTSAQDVRRAMESLALIRRKIHVYCSSLLTSWLFSSATIVPKFDVSVSTSLPRYSHSGAQNGRSRSHCNILGGRHPCKAWRCDFMHCERHARSLHQPRSS
jgi:hypothetical protein